MINANETDSTGGGICEALSEGIRRVIGNSHGLRGKNEGDP